MANVRDINRLFQEQEQLKEKKLAEEELAKKKQEVKEHVAELAKLRGNAFSASEEKHVEELVKEAINAYKYPLINKWKNKSTAWQELATQAAQLVHSEILFCLRKRMDPIFRTPRARIFDYESLEQIGIQAFKHQLLEIPREETDFPAIKQFISENSKELTAIIIWLNHENDDWSDLASKVSKQLELDLKEFLEKLNTQTEEIYSILGKELEAETFHDDDISFVKKCIKHFLLLYSDDKSINKDDPKVLSKLLDDILYQLDVEQNYSISPSSEPTPTPTSENPLAEKEPETSSSEGNDNSARSDNYCMIPRA